MRGLPPSRVSCRATALAFVRRREAKSCMRAARSIPGTPRQSRNASAAASTARSASLPLARGTSSRISSVAGLSIGKLFLEELPTHLPPIHIFCMRDTSENEKGARVADRRIIPAGRAAEAPGASEGQDPQRLVQGLDQAVEVRLGDVERRLDADHLGLVEGVGDQNPLTVEALRQGAPQRLVAHLDADQEPLLAHLADGPGVFLLKPA